MKPKVIHQEAMDFSFKAKQALEQGNYTAAFDLYIEAASLESQVAEFYFDKPELEPTRSVVIRSAAYLNIKAGQIEPKENAPLILTEEILLNAIFNSEIGFTILFEDFRIEYTDIVYEKTLKGFYTAFYEKIKYLANAKDKNEEEQKDWQVAIKLIGNTDALKK